MHAKIDKSVLNISEPKRIRSKEHLHFVASQPCLICGRTPSHAHHIRYAQTRGLNLKVSDEFTVPLCAIHHHDIHTTGNEQAWWQERNIDPLNVASALWQQSRNRQRSDLPSAEQTEDAVPKDRESQPSQQVPSEIHTDAGSVRDSSSDAGARN